MSRCANGLLDDSCAMCDPAPTVTEMVSCFPEVGPLIARIFSLSVVQRWGAAPLMDPLT